VNASNLIAWLVCLGLAFFASAMAVLNRGNVILAEKKIQQMRQENASAAAQSAVLEDIRVLLGHIDTRLRQDASARADVSSLPGKVEELEDRIAALESQLEGQAARPDQ